MTQEEKQLLLKDLCARLPYDVCVHIRYKTGKPCYGKLTSIDIQWFINSKIENIKPYLRPMSSMTEKEFINLIMGKTLPENLSIRFRIPILWGGALDISNMFLCWTFPHAYNMDRFIIEQSDATTIYLPNPEKKVYLTSHTGGGGAGGNSTSDRLTQAAFNAISGRGNE